MVDKDGSPDVTGEPSLSCIKSNRPFPKEVIHYKQIQLKGEYSMNNKKNTNNKSIVKEQNLTYDDYASLDDGLRYELVKGNLELMSPGPSTTHQLLNQGIYEQITFTCKSDYFIFFAPIDVILSSTDVRQPDIAMVSRKRMDILTNRGIEGAPDLVVEIISPSSVKRDKLDKLATYASYEIPEYWIVDPGMESLEQYVLKENRYELVELYQNDEQITSPYISCVTFTMNEVMKDIPNFDK